MEANDDKRSQLEELASVRAKRDKLPADSLVRQALSDDVLREVEEKILRKSAADLGYEFWPPVYGLFALLRDETIATLDADVRIVTQNIAPSKIPGITQFLRTKEGDKQGEWYGGLFELWAKVTAVKNGRQFEFDRPLANQRDTDMCLSINGRQFHVECTVLSQDDESDAVWRRFLVDKRRDPSKVLIRPGPYCPPHAKGPSVYYVTRRFYAKVFDKLGKHLNPSKSQFSDDGPNVLLVSCTGHGVRADHPGIGWALDELFCAQPKLGRTTADETIPDISLGAWVDYRVNELMSEGKMKPDWYLDHSNDVIAAPRRLGAILLFDGCRLSRSRINYNVKDCCLVSHGEMVELEEIFNNQVPYWR